MKALIVSPRLRVWSWQYFKIPCWLHWWQHHSAMLHYCSLLADTGSIVFFYPSITLFEKYITMLCVVVNASLACLNNPAGCYLKIVRGIITFFTFKAYETVKAWHLFLSVLFPPPQACFAPVPYQRFTMKVMRWTCEQPCPCSSCHLTFTDSYQTTMPLPPR